MFQGIDSEERQQENNKDSGSQEEIDNAGNNCDAVQLQDNPAAAAATLLPRPIAQLISFLTHSTSLSLRIGTLFGGAAIDGARATTLTGLELSRAVIEGVLTRAGRDVAIRSSGERGKVEAESLLERSVCPP